jgi:hypothetical protein
MSRTYEEKQQECHVQIGKIIDAAIRRIEPLFLGAHDAASLAVLIEPYMKALKEEVRTSGWVSSTPFSMFYRTRQGPQDGMMEIVVHTSASLTPHAYMCRVGWKEA